MINVDKLISYFFDFFQIIVKQQYSALLLTPQMVVKREKTVPLGLKTWRKKLFKTVEKAFSKKAYS
jgi:hypothetical protein